MIDLSLDDEYWGLGIGDWDWAQSPIPNPPIPILSKNLFL